MPKAIAGKRWAAVSAECATVTKVNNDNAIVDNDNDNEEDEGDYDSRVLVVDPVNIGDNDDDDSDDDNGALFMEVDSKDLGDDDDSELVIDDDYDGRDEQERGNNSESESYDPLSLVSVGLDDEEDDNEDDLTTLSATCSFCQKTFTERKHLTRHIKSVHQKACSVACQYCGRVLSDQDSYKRHINTVHKVKVPAGDVAATAADSINISFPQPVLSVTALAKQCPDCSLKFATKTTLNLHRLKTHVVALKQLPCPQCKQECPDLTAHMRRFHDVQGIVCPHCANIFSKKCTLNRHIEQVHLNIQIHKPATCPQCGKLFSKKGHLDRHIKIIHKGIKDYSDPCPYCKKVFTTRASLEPHIAMVHEGIRKKCPICNKVLSDLNKHMRTVHHTYRRRAKIPKDMLTELDSPADLGGIEPQIYGAKPRPPPSPKQDVAIVVKEEPTAKHEPPGSLLPPTLVVNDGGKPIVLSAVIDQAKIAASNVIILVPPPLLTASALSVGDASKSPLRTGSTMITMATTKPVMSATKNGLVSVPTAIPMAAKRISQDFQFSAVSPASERKAGGRPELNLETIKQELGLSDVITLQKISKPNNVQPPPPPPTTLLPPPPKLSYHGPPVALLPFITTSSQSPPPPVLPPGPTSQGSSPPPLMQRTQTFGSITLTPLSPSTTTTAAAIDRRQVMVKITGKPKKGLTMAASNQYGQQKSSSMATWQSFKTLKREAS